MIALMRSLDKVICTNQKVIEINGTTETRIMREKTVLTKIRALTIKHVMLVK